MEAGETYEEEGSEYRRWNLDELASEDVELIIPPGESG
jgi:hypothetical protein